jgi:hypothetical protein
MTKQEIEALRKKAESYINGYDDGMASHSEWTLSEAIIKLIEHIGKLERAVEKARSHITWLAVYSEKYKGTDAWMSATRANQEIDEILK